MKSLLTILILATTIFAQNGKDSKKSFYSYTPVFTVDMVNKKGETSEKTDVDFYLQVPYANLQFIKDGNSYEAKYTGTITIYDDDKENIIREISWNKNITVESFQQTTSKQSYNIELKSVSLKPGDYFLRLSIYDIDSKKDFSLEYPINILEFDEDVSLSDIIVIKERISTPDGISLVPNISRFITSDIEELAFFFEVYSDTNKSVKLEYSLSDKKEKYLAKYLDTLELVSGSNLLNYRFINPQLSLGEYNIIVKVFDQEEDELTSIGKRVFSQIYGFPKSINDLDEAIQQMIYISNTDIVDELLEIEEYQDRLDAFIAYWKEKDPSKNTVENEILIEYYRRVDYANKHFKDFRKGWRSDMGMIFITLGPPSHIERHPFDSNSKPYEVWQYYDMNRQFVFVDETGFGDYRLINTNYQDWSRYRY